VTRFLSLAALAGLLVGLGLGLEANVSGVVLGFYGLTLGALLGVTYLALRRRNGRRSADDLRSGVSRVTRCNFVTTRDAERAHPTSSRNHVSDYLSEVYSSVDEENRDKCGNPIGLLAVADHVLDGVQASLRQTSAVAPGRSSTSP